MADISSGGANRIELESQILCSSLRLSWAGDDTEGVLTVVRQLYQLFPDLLPPPRQGQTQKPTNNYQLLNLRCDTPTGGVIVGYLRAAKKFLRAANPKDRRDDYFKILDAGFTLRKPRLRLSHDLVVVRSWMIDLKVIPEDGTLEALQVTPSQTEAPPPQMVRTQPIEPTMPLLFDLLKSAQIIGPADIQALTNQMTLAPEIPLQELVLSAGYVTDQELKSLQLAEYLLSQGKISMAQFAVAMYDERTTGIRMAESLQVRGWLETQVAKFGEEQPKKD